MSTKEKRNSEKQGKEIYSDLFGVATSGRGANVGPGDTPTTPEPSLGTDMRFRFEMMPRGYALLSPSQDLSATHPQPLRSVSQNYGKSLLGGQALP